MPRKSTPANTDDRIIKSFSCPISNRDDLLNVINKGTQYGLGNDLSNMIVKFITEASKTIKQQEEKAMANNMNMNRENNQQQPQPQPNPINITYIINNIIANNNFTTNNNNLQKPQTIKDVRTLFAYLKEWMNDQSRLPGEIEETQNLANEIIPFGNPIYTRQLHKLREEEYRTYKGME